jgi:short-subunit dehydrogenase
LDNIVTQTIHGKTALITGASSGLGEVFARKLAQRGYDLVLVARREERLRQLADELSAARDVRANVCAADLADDAELERVAETIAALPALELLVNNAGFGTMGRVADTEVQPLLNMLRVHALATVRLSRAALPGMIERNRGRIINVSSIGAWLTAAGNVQYAATKMFLNIFSEGLQDELRNTDVRVQALCPGFTYTEFHDVASMDRFDRADIPKWLWMSGDDVVDCSLKMLDRKKVIVIPGWHNRMIARILRSSWLKPIVRAFSRYKEQPK